MVGVTRSLLWLMHVCLVVFARSLAGGIMKSYLPRIRRTRQGKSSGMLRCCAEPRDREEQVFVEQMRSNRCVLGLIARVIFSQVLSTSERPFWPLLLFSGTPSAAEAKN